MLLTMDTHWRDANTKQVFFLCAFLSAFYSLEASNPCATFSFTSLGTDLVTADITSTINISFRLDPLQPNCTSTTNFIITVSKQKTNTLDKEHFCKILHTNGHCTATSSAAGCPCPSDDGVYTFTKDDVDMSDNATWWWKASNGVAEEKKLIFLVTKSPTVKSLIFYKNGKELTRPAKPGTSVTAVCTVDPGSPPVDPVMGNIRGNEMKRSEGDSSRVVYYTIPRVRCRDMRTYRCEAGDSYDVATLLVQCPPTIKLLNSVSNVTGTDLQLEVKTHSTQLHGCKLNDSRSEVGCSVVKVTGTPPDLLMSVRLHGVTSEDKGVWQLTLTNDAGPGHVNFSLTDNTDPAEGAEQSGSRDHNDHQSVTSPVTAGAAVVVAVVVVVTAMCWACKKRKHAKERLQLGLLDAERLQRMLSNQIGMALNSHLPLDEDCVIMNSVYQGSGSLSGISESPYAEVNDYSTASMVVDFDNKPSATVPSELLLTV